MAEQGRIVCKDNQNLKIEVHRTSACENCRSCRFGDNETVLLDFKSNIPVKVGDIVKFEHSAGNVLWASTIAYLFPLAMLFLGLVVGVWLFPQSDEIYGAVFGLAMCVVSYVVIMILERKKKFERYVPKILEVISSQDDEPDEEHK